MKFKEIKPGMEPEESKPDCDSIKMAVFSEAWKISLLSAKRQHDMKLDGAWECCMNIIDRVGLIDEFNEWRDKKFKEEECEGTKHEV